MRTHAFIPARLSASASTHACMRTLACMPYGSALQILNPHRPHTSSSPSSHTIHLHHSSHAASQVVESPLSLDERMLALAAAISIDYDYFSRHSQGSGGGLLGPMFLPMPIPPVPYPAPEGSPEGVPPEGSPEGSPEGGAEPQGPGIDNEPRFPGELESGNAHLKCWHAWVKRPWMRQKCAGPESVVGNMLSSTLCPAL